MIATLGLVALTACRDESVRKEVGRVNLNGRQMFTLGIDLQDGFVDAQVSIRINDEEVFEKQSVQTRLLTGLADGLETQVGGGQVVIEVVVQIDADGELHETILLTVSRDTYLGISVTRDGIETIVRYEPFGYG